MKAFVLGDFDIEPGLRDDLPEPDPGDGQLVVRVQASSLNPVDTGVVAGTLRAFADYEFPVILGRDFAGVVERAGSGAELAEGDEVFGFVPASAPNVRYGAWAELALVPPRHATAKPSGVDAAAAGAAPVAALTALAALDALEIGDGETFLIVGATGGVGSFAVQLAKRRGAHVIAPGLPEDEGYLVGLGVDHVIDRESDVVAQARELESGGVDALLDAVSYAPTDFDVFAAALADEGRAASPTRAAGEGPGRHNIGGRPDGGAIERLAELLAGGDLRVPIQRTYGLDGAGTALDDLPSKHTQGKLAIAVAP